MDMRLVLEDGTEFLGQGFGVDSPVAGEVVFNTGMAGYVETLTDASYKGQLLVTTYPLIGSYGVPRPRITENIDPPYESNHIQVQGLIVQHYVDRYSHHAATRSLHEWLKADGIPAISGIDTRNLTRRLREFGTMRGWLFAAELSLEQAQKTSNEIDMVHEVFHLVAPSAPIRYEGGDLTVMLVDIGAKDNIIRSLLARGVSVLRVPWHANLAKIADQADGVLIGNGPGDPSELGELVKQTRDLMSRPDKKPIMGICLGNQILALAAGAKTYKLPYGHRGVNQPVQDLMSRRCFITSQNHGFAVADDSLPEGWEPWFVNINDGTNEGIRSRAEPYFSVQFHPEAKPGPEDTGFLFDDFLRVVGSMKRS